MTDKSLLITIGHGLVSRNLLRNRFLPEVLVNAHLKLIIVTPAATDPEFTEEFGHERIRFVDMPECPTRARRESLINALHAATVFNGTSHIKFLYRIQHKKSVWLNYWARKLSANLVGRSRLLRRFIAWLDTTLLPDQSYGAILDEHKPDVVFATSVVTRHEGDLLKAAKKRNIPTIGMVKSWDNLVKDLPLRIVPDELVVWNEIMKQQAMHTQLIPEQQLSVVGIPQFDIYNQTMAEPSQRDAFMQSIGADPAKKLLVFASEGKWSPGDPQIVQLITQFIENGQLAQNCHLHVRPHFCWGKFLPPLFALEKHGVVSVDKTWNETAYFPDGWDPDWKDMTHLANSMRYADVVITSPSTIALDAAYFDTPVINIGFDGDGEAAHDRTVRWLYETEYYKSVMKFDATTLVSGSEELRDAIGIYLDNPAHKRSERDRLRNAFAYRMDGQAGTRLAERILGFLKKHSKS